MPWRGPEYPGELPTLGYYVLDWLAENLIVPDGAAAGEPLLLTDEQALFVLKFYAIDPKFTGPAISGRALHNGRLVRRAVLSRPKGWGKSPILAALCIAEALAEVVPDGWDANGEPIGRPWADLGFKPKTQLVATSEDQTANAWDPLLEMARNGPVYDNYAIDPMETFVNVPRGRIEYVTSAGTSREGFRPVFSVLDQTESWIPSVNGPGLAATIRRNLAKVNGSSIEAPNAFEPGAESVAEKSFRAWTLQQEGRTKTKTGILVDHREAPADTDPTDRRSLMSGLAYVYGDSADVNGGWVSLERILQDYWDPDTDPQSARQYYLNQITHANDQWITGPELKACIDTSKVVTKREPITLGFDGSKKRGRGIADATALTGCRVKDGHVFDLGVWEQPDGPAGRDWEVPRLEVDTKVREVLRTMNVVGFYADPAKWETYIAAWEADFGTKFAVKASKAHPIEWWMTGGRASATSQALDEFHTAVVDRLLTYDGSSVLTRHLLNARRRMRRSGLQIGKETPDSPRKIDAAVSATLAYTCRLDAVVAGIGRKPSGTVRRIR